LPEIIYRYTRFHLEATIAFLEQYDEKLQIDVMSDKRITDCIDKIKMTFPADDVSHFSFDGNSNNSGAVSKTNGISALWDTYDNLVEEGLDDKSSEGQNLRSEIRKFIEENELEVVISRKSINEELLEEIEKCLAEGDDKSKKETPADPEPEEKETEPKEEEKEEPETPSRSARGRRNEDTNEPAERSDRTERRGSRPERSRR
jgi:hypothetical protein